jgi:hypothetical protein
MGNQEFNNQRDLALRGLRRRVSLAKKIVMILNAAFNTLRRGKPA